MEPIEGYKKELTDAQKEREKVIWNNSAITNQDAKAAESPTQWSKMQRLLCNKEYDLSK
jgi:hypothetical protein